MTLGSIEVEWFQTGWGDWLGCPDPAKPWVSFHIWGFSNNGQEKKKKKKAL